MPATREFRRQPPFRHVADDQNAQGGEPNINRECPDVTHRQVAGRDHQRRRLVLTSSQVVPDSHDRRFAAFAKRYSVKDGTFELQLSRSDCWLNVWGPCTLKTFPWRSGATNGRRSMCLFYGQQLKAVMNIHLWDGWSTFQRG